MQDQSINGVKKYQIRLLSKPELFSKIKKRSLKKHFLSIIASSVLF